MTRSVKLKTRLERVREFAERKMSGIKDPAHSMEHVLRVYALAETLCEGEDVDLDVIRVAALLHDIGNLREQEDKTGETDHAVESVRMARPFLRKLGYPEKKIAHICDCILSHRYRTDRDPETLEAKILFDADKLDSIGAVGVARSFCWFGRNNAHIYRKVEDIDAYVKENLGGKPNGRIRDKSKHSPQLQWETRDKFILRRLQTDKAKHIGARRKRFSEFYLRKLEREVLGKE